MRHAIIEDGGIAYVDKDLNADSTLEYLQKTVGGYIQLVGRHHMPGGGSIALFADDEGRMKRYKPTLAIKRPYAESDLIIVGTVVITHVDKEGNDTSLTKADEAYIAQMFESKQWHIIVPTLKLNRVK